MSPQLCWFISWILPSPYPSNLASYLPLKFWFLRLPTYLLQAYFSGTKHCFVVTFFYMLDNLKLIHGFPHSEGRRHDAGMLHMSGLLTELNRHAYSPTAQPLCIYGDPAYPFRIYLQAPYRNAQLQQNNKFSILLWAQSEQLLSGFLETFQPILHYLTLREIWK